MSKAEIKAVIIIIILRRIPYLLNLVFFLCMYMATSRFDHESWENHDKLTYPSNLILLRLCPTSAWQSQLVRIVNLAS